jgi:hypothetical protein
MSNRTVNINVHHVTRIEGHAKITIYQDDDGNVSDAKFHVVGTSMEKYWTFQFLTRAKWTSVPRGASLLPSRVIRRPAGRSLQGLSRSG